MLQPTPQTQIEAQAPRKGTVRPMTAADVPGVARLFLKVFRGADKPAGADLENYLQALVLGSPSYEAMAGTQIYQQQDGRIRSALLLRLWLAERVEGAGIAVLALALAQVVTVPSVAEFSLARGDKFILEGLTPVLSAYVLAFVVFLAAAFFDRPRSIWLARIGLISYSMYLFHWCVNVVVYRFLPFTGQVGDVFTMLICIVLTLIASWLVYRTVERPMIMFGRTILLRRGAKRC
ncbi:acyltransferase [Bradyrhizobium genosp. L]|uniref:acyltransferase family protein n=1 Tax=Bradyrhizobium genosp. L TaxID=83637 RepID=UPI0018A26CC3|nr:acyltransferase [Bradyrhizobium genosp. L]QPF84595.1 acyltransferase [Bradyrhizobium genosp. L]